MADRPHLPTAPRLWAHPSLWLSLAVAAALKAVLWFTGSVSFNADEAILALMARHILQGARPLFFYGQAYMGALDAYLVAASFAVFGQTIFAARLVQALLAVSVVATTYALAWRLSADRFAAGAASLMVALPPVLTSLYTTAGIGDYGEVLLLNNLLLLLGWNLLGGRRSHPVGWLLAGLLAGVGWWSMALIVVSAGPLTLLALGRLRRGAPDRLSWQGLIAAAGGFLLGAAPWIAATLAGGVGGSTAADLLGARVNRPDAGLVGEVGERLFSLFLFNLPALTGLRPPWSVEWIALPAGLLAAGLYALAGWRGLRRAFSPTEEPRARLALQSLIGGWLIVLAAFVATPFGRDPTGRYLLHLYPPLALLTADWLGRARRGLEGLPARLQPALPVALLLFCLGYNLWGNVRSILRDPPGLTTQFDLISHLPHEYDAHLIRFLDSVGADRGYSNYWVSYRLAFLTRERLIFTPRLPYKADLSYTFADERYRPYAEAVAAADRVAYVTSNLPALDEFLRGRFAALGVRYAERAVGPYTVFYDLSRPVRPDEIAPDGHFTSTRP